MCRSRSVAWKSHCEVIGCGPRYEAWRYRQRIRPGTVTVDGNKRLYPDADLWQKGVMNIHLNQGIRSKSGLEPERGCRASNNPR